MITRRGFTKLLGLLPFIGVPIPDKPPVEVAKEDLVDQACREIKEWQIRKGGCVSKKPHYLVAKLKDIPEAKRIVKGLG